MKFLDQVLFGMETEQVHYSAHGYDPAALENRGNQIASILAKRSACWGTGNVEGMLPTFPAVYILEG